MSVLRDKRKYLMYGGKIGEDRTLYFKKRNNENKIIRRNNNIVNNTIKKSVTEDNISIPFFEFEDIKIKKTNITDKI